MLLAPRGLASSLPGLAHSDRAKRCRSRSAESARVTHTWLPVTAIRDDIAEGVPRAEMAGLAHNSAAFWIARWPWAGRAGARRGWYRQDMPDRSVGGDRRGFAHNRCPGSLHGD